VHGNNIVGITQKSHESCQKAKLFYVIKMSHHEQIKMLDMQQLCEKVANMLHHFLLKNITTNSFYVVSLLSLFLSKLKLG
jgi:hypothetical protein